MSHQVMIKQGSTMSIKIENKNLHIELERVTKQCDEWCNKYVSTLEVNQNLSAALLKATDAWKFIPIKADEASKVPVKNLNKNDFDWALDQHQQKKETPPTKFTTMEGYKHQIEQLKEDKQKMYEELQNAYDEMYELRREKSRLGIEIVNNQAVEISNERFLKKVTKLTKENEQLQEALKLKAKSSIKFTTIEGYEHQIDELQKENEKISRRLNRTKQIMEEILIGEREITQNMFDIDQNQELALTFKRVQEMYCSLKKSLTLDDIKHENDHISLEEKEQMKLLQDMFEKRENNYFSEEELKKRQECFKNYTEKK